MTNISSFNSVVSNQTEARDRLEVCYETYTAAEDEEAAIFGVSARFNDANVTNECLIDTFSDDDDVNIRHWAQRKANETGRSIDVEVYEAWECWDGRTSESTLAQFTIEPDPSKTEPNCDPCDVDGWEFELPDPIDWEYEPGGPMYDPFEVVQYDFEEPVGDENDPA